MYISKNTFTCAIPCNQKMVLINLYLCSYEKKAEVNGTSDGFSGQQHGLLIGIQSDSAFNRKMTVYCIIRKTLYDDFLCLVNS